MKNNMYLLYKFQWGDWGEGGENVLISVVIGQDMNHAIWQFKLMGYSDITQENRGYKIEEVSPFDDEGYMFQIPEYLIPDQNNQNSTYHLNCGRQSCDLF